MRAYFESGGERRPPARAHNVEDEGIARDHEGNAAGSEENARVASDESGTTRGGTEGEDVKPTNAKPMSEKQRIARDLGQWAKGMMVCPRCMPSLDSR